MPVLSFKGKTAVETYHHTVPHHTLEFDKKLSCLPKGEDAHRRDNWCCMMYPRPMLLEEPLRVAGAIFVTRAETRLIQKSGTTVRRQAKNVLAGSE